jgi:ribosomal protein S18 acetylase RimI-like enzyme
MGSVMTTGIDCKIRRAQQGDIPQIVEVHLASFQNFFLTFLGRAFLERLYTEIAAESGGVVLVATSAEGAVIGFAAGVPHLAEFYKRLIRGKWLTFGLASIRAAILRPTVIPRLGRALKAAENAKEAACPGTLMSIAVAPEAKGMGVGKSLISQFLQEMQQRGVPMICLTTDRDNNDATLGFYEGFGFRKLREFRTREGRWLCEFMIETR